MSNAEWPHIVEKSQPVRVPDIPSKSPMKYAVDYVAVDLDGNVITDTDYFIMKEFAWDRVRELYEEANDVRTVTFREL